VVIGSAMASRPGGVVPACFEFRQHITPDRLLGRRHDWANVLVVSFEQSKITIKLDEEVS